MKVGGIDVALPVHCASYAGGVHPNSLTRRSVFGGEGPVVPVAIDGDNNATKIGRTILHNAADDNIASSVEHHCRSVSVADPLTKDELPWTFRSLNPEQRAFWGIFAQQGPPE